MSSCPFLKLPPELREPIYRHVLVREAQPVRPKNWDFRSRPSGQFTAILATSRAIYLEALPTLHSGNKFEISVSYYDYNWLKKLGLQGRNELRHLLIWTNVNHRLEDTGIFTLLAQCANLALTIKGSIYQLRLLHKRHRLKHLHGFSQISVTETAPATPNWGCFDAFPFWWTHVELEQGKITLRSLEAHFGSACPQGCRVHAGKGTMRPRVSLRVECNMHCCSLYY